MTMKVLITGAGGFIGSHLADSQLEKGNSVRAVDLNVDRLEQAANHPNIEIIRGDITNQDLVHQLVKGVEVVYHLASAHLDVSLSDEHYRKVNVDATLGLLEAARGAGVRRFVHCSSVGVIGDVMHPPADETSPCQPTNIYEQTKLEGERATLEFSLRTGFPVVVARPAWVYGPRCPRTEKLFRAIAKGRFPIFGKGHNLRHPIYITDAVHGLELCDEVDRTAGEVYILAGSEPVMVIDLIHMISEELDVSPPRLHLPIMVGKGGGTALEMVFKPLGRQPPFSRRSVDFFLKHNAYDISKAQHELGFQPKIDLRTGIQSTIRWQKEREMKETPRKTHG
jgi:dihydroflavonol-4-reductase